MKRRIRVLVPILVVAFLAPVVRATGQEPVQAPERREGRAGATVSVDRVNYKPGDTAIIKGAGFLPGELVACGSRTPTVRTRVRRICHSRS